MLSAMFIRRDSDYVDMEDREVDRFTADQLNIDLIRLFDRQGGFELCLNEQFQVRFAGFESIAGEEPAAFII
jgi:hypothetical protein